MDKMKEFSVTIGKNTHINEFPITVSHILGQKK